MILGDPTHFSRDHFEAQKGVAPAYLCELVVHCLELVAQLAHQDLVFRFKGGNSLLVILEDPQRFSIDVDIVTTVSKEDLTATVERVVEACSLFSRVEPRAPKTKPWLPMISYKLFFDSLYQKADDAYVMLDAVLEPPPYDGMRKTIQCGGLYRSQHDVELPSISGLMGDKLLCIGPSTLGIPVGKKKEAQRLKHVFDVSMLAQHEHDTDDIARSVEACMAQENKMQVSNWSLADVLADTSKFLNEPLGFEQKPDAEGIDPNSYLGEIVRGFDEFKTFLFRSEYSWPRFRGDCTRVLDIVQRLSR